jgi:hypothetical protein
MRIQNIRFATNNNSNSDFSFPYRCIAPGRRFLSCWYVGYGAQYRDRIWCGVGSAGIGGVAVGRPGYGLGYMLVCGNVCNAIWCHIWRFGIWPMKRRMADEMRSGVCRFSAKLINNNYILIWIRGEKIYWIVYWMETLFLSLFANWQTNYKQ